MESRDKDYSSFGHLTEESPKERRIRENCRENYEELVQMLGKYERSAELWKQLDLAKCDIQGGCNDNVAGFDIKQHPLGSTDANLHIFTKEVNNGIICVPAYTPGGDPVKTTVLKVRFLSLINSLALGPMGLEEHDVYVVHKFKDPLSYFQPGYFLDKNPTKDGKVVLQLNPESIEDPDFQNEPGDDDFQKKAKEHKFTEDDLEGMEVVPGADNGPEDGLHRGKHRVTVITSQRGIMG